MSPRIKRTIGTKWGGCGHTAADVAARPKERWPADHPLATVFANLCKYQPANDDFEFPAYVKFLGKHMTSLKITREEMEKLSADWVQ